MEVNLFVGGEDGECNGVSFVDVSKLFATHDTFIFGTISFDRVQVADISCRIMMAPYAGSMLYTRASKLWNSHKIDVIT